MVIENTFILERLRTARGFKSQEQFVDGICDARQYRRYISNESGMPMEIFMLLIGRLNMKFDEALKYYADASIKETRDVHAIYNHLMSGNLSNAQELIEKYSGHSFVDKATETLLIFCVHFMQYKKEISPTLQYRDKISKLIKYPDLLTFEILTLYEMLILSNFIKTLPPQEQEDVVTKLSDSIQTMEVSDLNELDYHMVILFTLVKYHGEKRRFEHAIDLCDRGAKLSRFFIIIIYLHILITSNHCVATN